MENSTEYIDREKPALMHCGVPVFASVSVSFGEAFVTGYHIGETDICFGRIEEAIKAIDLNRGVKE
jgi:hypothetical protein